MAQIQLPALTNAEPNVQKSNAPLENELELNELESYAAIILSTNHRLLRFLVLGYC